MAETKVAIITAGGSGMGADAARKLAEEGFKVAILSSSGKGAALAEKLGGIGVTGSNRSNDDLKRLVDERSPAGAASTRRSTVPRTGRARRSSISPTKTGTPAWRSISSTPCASPGW